MKRVNKDELINYNLCLSVLILVFFERGFVGRSRESANGGGSDVLFNSFWNRNFFGSRIININFGMQIFFGGKWDVVTPPKKETNNKNK